MCHAAIVHDDLAQSPGGAATIPGFPRLSWEKWMKNPLFEAGSHSFEKQQGMIGDLTLSGRFLITCLSFAG